MNHDATCYMTESERGALVVDIGTAGVTVRRLARKYKLAPVGEVRRLKVRYLAKDGLSLDAFAELLTDSVCAGRPSPDRACELLEMFVRGRRGTHAEVADERTSIEQMVAIAHTDLATQTAARRGLGRARETWIEAHPVGVLLHTPGHGSGVLEVAIAGDVRRVRLAVPAEVHRADAGPRHDRRDRVCTFLRNAS